MASNEAMVCQMEGTVKTTNPIDFKNRREDLHEQS
jgi:hypothetical protein